VVSAWACVVGHVDIDPSGQLAVSLRDLGRTVLWCHVLEPQPHR
jgi:hypothetical protein